jgi:hypothetical protein
MKRAVIIVTLLISAALPARATVDLTLYNSFPLLDSNGSTYLEGATLSGDLVQLILVGPNGIIDTPSGSGGVTGDDVLLFTSHVGAGYPTPTDGFLVQSSILYADSFAGTNAYVRFWNSNTAANADYYGTSMIFALPAGDAFGLAEFDFVPLSSSPRTANIPFSGSGGGPSAVPEPSQLFLLGLGIVGARLYRRWRRGLLTLLAAMSLALFASRASAQIAAPLDAQAGVSILNADGSVLPGNNPYAAALGYTQIPGCLVQILNVGANGVADLPNLDGTPGGDDALFATTVIGQGIPSEVTESGRFSTSFYPPPAQGVKVYARVFNATNVVAATHWGQSATFTVHNVDVFDVSNRGLAATTQPKGTNPQTTDTDGDGQTDYQELIANTNPLLAGDRFDAGRIQPGIGQTVEVRVAARAGRQYVLQRTTDDLNAAPVWADVPGTATGILNADQPLDLTDPNPPGTPKAFYRVKVTMP